MNSLNDQVTAALQSYMDDHGIQRQSVARHLGRSASYITGRMNGNNHISFDIIGAVAELSYMSPRAFMVELTERMMRNDGSGAGHTPMPVRASGRNDAAAPLI